MHGIKWSVASIGVNALALLFALVLLIGIGQNVSAAPVIEYDELKTLPLQEAYKIKQKWHATIYDIKNASRVNEYCGKFPDDCKDENNKIPAAKICFWNDPAKMHQHCERVEDDKYTYEKVSDVIIVRLCEDCESKVGMLLRAENYGFEVGRLYSVSIWVFDPMAGKFVNSLPSFRFTEQGEYKILPELRIVAKADANIDWENETRYAPHRFRIEFIG